MKDDGFEEPVRIYVGLNFRKEAASAADAYAFLDNWPLDQRNSDHTAAFRACHAALLGGIDPETARGTFRAFARRAGILAPEMDDIVAAGVVRRFGAQAAG